MEKLKLIRATKSDFSQIRKFYDAVIDGTENMEKYCKWKKGSHPFDDTIFGYIRNNEMYMCLFEDRMIGVMAVPFSQDEEYKNIHWSVEAGNDEVASLHMFCIAPEYQGKGYGTMVLELVLDMARENRIKAFRLDTFAIKHPSSEII